MCAINRTVATIAFALLSSSVAGSDCDVTSVGFTPIDDLGAGQYLGMFEGGLFPGGVNTRPAMHEQAGLDRALAIAPLDTQGAPDPDGKYVMVSIGMSNTTQEFCSQGGGEPCAPWTFMGQAAKQPEVNDTTLVIVNGAAGGQAAGAWESPNHQNYNRVRDTVLAPRGLTEAQVQIAWVKVANPQPTVSLPSPNADAYRLMTSTGNIVRALRIRYPNMKLVFLSSRIYAGYASTTLNPEPYAYESSFSAKWLIEAQINQMAGGGIEPNAGDLDYSTVAPWLGWASYLWADGLVARSDGLTWECGDLQSDGTHPSQSGEEKVGGLLLDFFLHDSATRPWFTSSACSADLDASGAVDFGDILAILATWGPCAGCPEDLNDNGAVDIGDLLIVLGSWGPCA